MATDIDLAKFKAKSKLTDRHVRNQSSVETLRELSEEVGNDALPGFLVEFIESTSLNELGSLAIHTASSIAGSADADKEAISRDKGFMGKSQLEPSKFRNAVHHVKIFYNESNKARVFYKFKGSLKFVQNLKRPPGGNEA